MTFNLIWHKSIHYLPEEFSLRKLLFFAKGIWQVLKSFWAVLYNCGITILHGELRPSRNLLRWDIFLKKNFLSFM
jgi:hypothetical protein